MKTDLFDYPFSRDLIAQEPLQYRDDSRLMLVERDTGGISHHGFKDLPGLLKKGDCLVFNNSRVMPSRLDAVKEPTGGSVELLLLMELSQGRWSVLSRGASIRRGVALSFPGSEVTALVTDGPVEGKSTVRFRMPGDSQADLKAELFKIGKVPLPPYIDNNGINGERYQTVFSNREISAAAPTAGLHFTDNLISEIRRKKVSVADLELAVGVDTFIPIREEDIEDHEIHREWFSVGDDCARAINSAERVVAVGTTSMRALESARYENGELFSTTGFTDLYITPGYTFHVVRAMITNFHFPRSTLMVLVSAFAGRELVQKAYNEAIREGYRFFSFGDAMLVI
ncbi:MAG: tRNA preQ1(34) S-adenosylmethionine ribosyltransferase-isomerase QueA [Actinobacteria bacterium]|nr:tRNA preQ1(34) S-adenosylmethionine ribosyltransferase-isomerase QueA [Actinomycetota bacterium]